MVSFVIVSHSALLSEGVCDLAKMMAAEVPVYPAGGMEDGSWGTSIDRISAALEKASSADGTVVLADMGSAVMTAELALEACGRENVRLADCPIAEGAAMGALLAAAGASMEEILSEVSTVGTQKKLE